MARPVTRPEGSDRQGSLEPPPIDAGPTAVHSWLDRASAWLRVKMRKLAVALSLPGSPRPEVGSGFWKVSDQPLNVPVPPVVELFVMVNTQVPCTLVPSGAGANAVASDCCGLNVAKNGALPSWIGVAALSSKTVLSKLAVVVPAPTPLKSDHLAELEIARAVMGQGRRQIGIGGIGQVDLDLHAAGPRCRLVTLDDEVVGHGDRRGHLARGRAVGAGMVWAGRSRCSDGGRRAVLILTPQHGQARVLVGVERVAERVQMFGPSWIV